MHSLIRCFVLTLLLMAPGLLAVAQVPEPDAKPADSASGNATKQEVEQLRQEVREQRQTIEQLKALVQQLVDAKGDAKSAQAPAAAAEPQVVNATLVTPPAQADQPKTEKKEAPIVAGWTNEHFFIRSADGKFQLQPYGYTQLDYRAYSGDGAPADSFVLRRARLGFQGNYGKYIDFAVLIDGVAVQGTNVRDAYINLKPFPQFQVQVGQFKVPFAQEEFDSDANILFIERSLASLLYPDVVGTFRAPGAMAQGNIADGVMQYWIGAFNGKGLATANTTNVPETIGRVRFYPWRKNKDSMLHGFAFGGAFSYGKNRGLSGETSFSATLPDGAFTFFPTFLVNGPATRFEGEFLWGYGPWSLSGNYTQLLQERVGIGSSAFNGLGFTTLPGVKAKAGYAQISYLLNGGVFVENGAPKVKHPVIGPEGPGGAGPGIGLFEVAFRYDRIQARAPGVNLLNNPFTPGFVPDFNNHTDAFTLGVNWYLNYWVKYMVDFSADRLQQPSTIGVLPQNYFVVLNRLQFRF